MCVMRKESLNFMEKPLIANGAEIFRAIGDKKLSDS
jgi:hypothetical protein